MSVASVVMESAVNSLHSGTVEDDSDKLFSSQQNGCPHVTYTTSVNSTDNNCYVDSSPTTPLLLVQYKDSLEDDGADASEEASSDSETGPSVFLKHDSGTSIGEETSLRIALQVFFPYLVAGFGMVGAGAVLEIVKNWKVFLDVPEMIILVPPLLGLKGNLEMTLASRLSTQANLGRMDSATEQWKMIYGNISLIQAQALLVGLLAALFAIVLGWVPEGKLSVTHGLLMAASSVLTAGIASFVLGVVMVAVVVLSRRFHINPDNVATPIAASLGDLTTISLLAALARGLFSVVDTSSCAADASCRSYFWLLPLLLSLALMLVPVWWCLAHYNKYTNDVLYSGWTPVIGAMVISSLGGLVLDYTVVSYDEVAVFQPVINGVGGNLVAVQASRLSTALHRISTPGILPDSAVHGCPSPLSTFFSKSVSARTARVLVLMVIPGQIIFILLIYVIEPHKKSVDITPLFAVIYITAAIIQVVLLLYIANWLVHLLWRRGSDPDNSAIPYLTAAGDLLGTVLLALAFFVLTLLSGLTAGRHKVKVP